MVKITRRRLLEAGAIGGALLGSYAVFKWITGEPTEIIVAILHRRVGHLQVDTESFEVFAKDFVAWKSEDTERLSLLSIVALPMRLVSTYRLLPTGHPLRRLENSVVSRYLLSTDFFLYGADESREVNYLSFYDPLTAVCRNPFAQPVTA